MKLQRILFSFDGRIGRGTYWLSIVPLFVAVQLITIAPVLIVGFIVGTESEDIPGSILIAIFAAQLIWLAGQWPMLAVGSKRLHDRNKRGWWLLVWWVLPFLLFFGGFGFDFTSRSGDFSGNFSTGLILMVASLLPALWGIVELGILPGTKGPNLYGADPAQQA
jgi:uncharacterized membrane protein YhaH (DUF805 family)